jgi:hypothetical protein
MNLFNQLIRKLMYKDTTIFRCYENSSTRKFVNRIFVDPVQKAKILRPLVLFFRSTDFRHIYMVDEFRGDEFTGRRIFVIPIFNDNTGDIVCTEECSYK